MLPTRWMRLGACLSALVLGASGALAQSRGEVHWAGSLLQRWSTLPPPSVPNQLIKIHGYAAEARARARRGESALPERLELTRLQQRSPVQFRDMWCAQRRFGPVGSAPERLAQLQFTLAVGVEGLIDILGIESAQVVDRIRSRSPRWLQHLHAFVDAAAARDYVAVDREFDMLSLPIAEVYEGELSKPWQAPAPSAPPRPSFAAVPVVSAPASATRPSPPPASGDARAAEALEHRKRLKKYAAALAIGLIALVLVARRLRRGPSDLTGPLGLLARGKPGEALPLLQAVLARRPPDEAEVRAHVIRCMVRMGQIELAMKALPELEITRVPPRVLYLLARDLEERSQTKAALELYARVYLVDADLEDTRERYERLRSSSGLSAAILTVEDLAARLPARYTKPELLGHGGMGVVLKAIDSQTARPVALKVIAPAVASDPAFVKRFRREVRALGALEHPSIISLFDSQLAPFPFYAMEYFEGVTLSKLLSGGPLPERRAAGIAAQIAGGLALAHAQGIVHRDIKPDNVLVGPGDTVKVLDFGLARLAGGTVLTQTGLTSGSAPYMAPEQLRGETCGPSTDVYALGLVLYLLVTGRSAFGTADPALRLSRSPERLAIGSAAFADLVEECLKLAPDARPATADVARRLEALSREHARGDVTV